MENEFSIKIPTHYQQNNKESLLNPNSLENSELILFELPKNVKIT
jgi:hypothetical protein